MCVCALPFLLSVEVPMWKMLNYLACFYVPIDSNSMIIVIRAHNSTVTFGSIYLVVQSTVLFSSTVSIGSHGERNSQALGKGGPSLCSM